MHLANPNKCGSTRFPLGEGSKEGPREQTETNASYPDIFILSCLGISRYTTRDSPTNYFYIDCVHGTYSGGTNSRYLATETSAPSGARHTASYQLLLPSPTLPRSSMGEASLCTLFSFPPLPAITPTQQGEG